MSRARLLPDGFPAIIIKSLFAAVAAALCAIKRRARFPSISKQREQKEAVNYAGNYLSNYGPFVIRFRNVSRSTERLSVSSL